MSRLFVLLAAVLCLVGAYLEEEYQVLHLVPKVELHAHLHGSIRLSTLHELSRAKGLPLPIAGELNLERCFQLFGALHKIVSTVDILKRITQEVLEDYMAENTIYLELRSTPRNLSDGTTAQQYVEVLVDLLEKHNIAHGDRMLVKLVLSIDRSTRFADAVDITELAADYRFISNGTDYPVRTIVGLDFSGNPHGGRFEDFSPLFDSAKDRGLGLTVHTAEVKELSDSVDPRTDEDDTESIINFQPDRLGHVLHLQQHHLDRLIELHNKNEAIPIEICPTSNLITLGHQAYHQHPYLHYWLNLGYPISINTDDRGIFNTTLTHELLQVKDAMRLELADIVRILASTINQSFASDEEKQRLNDKFFTQVRQLVEQSTAEGRIVGSDLLQSAPAVPTLTTLLTGRKDRPAGTGNVKDMQDMAYLLYI